MSKAINTADKDKARLRERIMALYPELVKKYTRELCLVCGFRDYGKCYYRLVPVTTKGERCPYYAVSSLVGTPLFQTLTPRKEIEEDIEVEVEVER